MEKPEISNYIKKDPSELTIGEILIGYQKYAKALEKYIEEQLRIQDVVGQSEQLCDHSGDEVLHQGNGFIYKTCADCGEDI